MKKTATLRKSANVLQTPSISVADLRGRWGKFDDRELAAIRSRHELVRLIQAKYGLDREQARTNVDVWAAGRDFLGERGG